MHSKNKTEYAVINLRVLKKDIKATNEYIEILF